MKSNLHINLRRGLVSTACGIALCGATLLSQAAVNQLNNPGFESGITGWTSYNSWAVESTNNTIYQSTANVMVHEGIRTFKTWGAFQSYDTYCGAFQDIPAAADSVWSANGWGLTHAGDKMVGLNQCWIEVSFRMASSPNTPLLTYLSPMMDANTPASTWTNLVVADGSGSTNLVAPFGTSFVRVQIVFKQIGNTYNGGSAYIDDLTLLKTSGPDPEITVHPFPQTRVYGQTATFSVVAGGRSALSYAWEKDGAPLSNGGRISGANTATLNVASVTTADQGFYAVTVTDAAGSLLSEMAYLTVLDPGIITNPTNLTRLVGETAAFSVTAAASSPMTYVWSKNGTPLSNGGRITGANTATLSISSLQATDAGDYSVAVTGTGGEAISQAAQLRVKTPADLANRLENPGFEDALLAPWIGFEGFGVEDTNALVFGSTTTYVSSHSGKKVAKVYGTVEWNGVFQDVPAAAGETFAADAWFRSELEDRIANANECWLEVQFRNSADAMMALYRSPHFTATTPASTWVYMAATNIIAFWGDYSIAGTAKYLVAPPDTAKVRYQVTYRSRPEGAGSIYVDDTRLMVKTPVTVSTAVSGSTLTLSFPTQGATSYQVLYKNSLTDANWQVLTTIEGDGSVKSATDTVAGTSRFYQVEIQ